LGLGLELRSGLGLGVRVRVIGLGLGFGFESRRGWLAAHTLASPKAETHEVLSCTDDRPSTRRELLTPSRSGTTRLAT
jgi:hypothetical protein